MSGKAKRRLIWIMVVVAVASLAAAGWWFVAAHKLERKGQSLSAEFQEKEASKVKELLIKWGLAEKTPKRTWDQIEPEFIALGKETVEALGITDESQQFKTMLSQLKDEKTERRILAAAALVYLDDVDAIPPLMEVVAKDSDPGVRTAAAMAVVVITPGTDDDKLNIVVRKMLFERIAWPGGQMNFSDAIICAHQRIGISCEIYWPKIYAAGITKEVLIQLPADSMTAAEILCRILVAAQGNEQLSFFYTPRLQFTTFNDFWGIKKQEQTRKKIIKQYDEALRRFNEGKPGAKKTFSELTMSVGSGRDYNGKQFIKILEECERNHQIKIVADWAALGKIGISPETYCVFSGWRDKNYDYGELLNMICISVSQNDKFSGYLVDGDKIIITSQEEINRMLFGPAGNPTFAPAETAPSATTEAVGG